MSMCLRNKHWKWSSNLTKQILRNGSEVWMLKWWCGSQTSCQSEVNSAFRLFCQSSGWSPASRPAEVSPLLRPWDAECSGAGQNQNIFALIVEFQGNKNLPQCLEVNRCFASLGNLWEVKKINLYVITEIKKINLVVCSSTLHGQGKQCSGAADKALMLMQIGPNYCTQYNMEYLSGQISGVNVGSIFDKTTLALAWKKCWADQGVSFWPLTLHQRMLIVFKDSVWLVHLTLVYFETDFVSLEECLFSNLNRSGSLDFTAQHGAENCFSGLDPTYFSKPCFSLVLLNSYHLATLHQHPNPSF